MDTDSGKRIKVVCRYQQYRAARKIVERLRSGKTPESRSGVVWHTQGSGKSLTMVFVARMLRASADLQDFKILLVNDRIDFEQQLANTARLVGGKVNVIESTAGLREHLGTDTSDVNMVMIHKFMEKTEALPEALVRALSPGSDSSRSIPSGRTFGVVNPSERIIIMIDEAHRTQSSELGENLFAAFPNATRIAFTGTPLIMEQHGEKRTDEELLAIKRKYGSTGDILEAENRIAAIARDMVNHYIDNVLPEGFKAQVVCHSKLAAVRYQKAIKEALRERIEQEKVDKVVPDYRERKEWLRLGRAEEEPGACTRRRNTPLRQASSGCEESPVPVTFRSRSARFCGDCRRLFGSSR